MLLEPQRGTPITAPAGASNCRFQVEERQTAVESTEKLKKPNIHAGFPRLQVTAEQFQWVGLKGMETQCETGTCSNFGDSTAVFSDQ
ncbi:hypothetical protein PY257_04430 [Ramlibacter sp. H39-3-26]|nr:hypothetical protein [Ramlibacter sp. H39-3-26]